MNSNLQRLRELTEALDISSITPATQIGDAFHYEFDGEAVTHGLVHNKDVAMARLHMEMGTTFPQHSHNMLEIFIMLEGTFEVDMCDQKWTVSKGQPFYVMPNIPHGGLAVTDMELIVVTIPADPSFPHPEGG